MHVDTRRFVLHFTSPTGHRYTRTPQPLLTPDLRVDSHPAGTAIAERLDTRAMFTTANGQTTSRIQERATTMLLRQHLNQPPREYVPDPTAWDTPDDPPAEPPAHPDNAGRPDDDEDDAPPF